MPAAMLPQTAEYALRAMWYLSARSSTEPLRAAELAHAAQIPMPYLQKVLRKLVVAGLLTARKGHHGGFTLARAPQEIRFSDVLTAVEYDIASDDHCAFGFARCRPSQPCPLHPALDALKRNVLSWAAEHTFADVDPKDLERLLSTPRA